MVAVSAIAARRAKAQAAFLAGTNSASHDTSEARINLANASILVKDEEGIVGISRTDAISVSGTPILSGHQTPLRLEEEEAISRSVTSFSCDFDSEC